MCSIVLPANHQHLLEPSIRQLICACQACAILFSGQANSKYRRIPQRIRFLADFHLTDAQWDSMMLPIGLVFIYDSSQSGKVVAIYPSPAGPTES
ncbi:MAG: DUF5947 family protein, partial [Pyrinomonadaceae bacterium]